MPHDLKKLEQVEDDDKHSPFAAHTPSPEDLVPGLGKSKDPISLPTAYGPHDEDGPFTPLTHVKQHVVDIPMRHRLIAFSMILFFSTGAAFSEATLGPLKSTLLKQLKINSEPLSIKRAGGVRWIARR
jgi:hypothetical protein